MYISSTYKKAKMNRFLLHIALLLCALQVHANDSIDAAGGKIY